MNLANINAYATMDIVAVANFVATSMSAKKTSTIAMTTRRVTTPNLALHVSPQLRQQLRQQSLQQRQLPCRQRPHT